jgi:hypothetical protein
VTDVAFEDQLAAAVAEGQHVMTDVAGMLGTPMRQYEAGENAAGPIGERIADWRRAAAGRRVRLGCPHPSRSAPQLLFGLLHNPTVVWCPSCAVVAANLDSALRPDQCDACGQWAEIFTEVTLNLGPLIFGGNVCGDCVQAAEAAS